MSPISQLICFTRAVTNVHWPAEYGGIILHHQQIDLFLTKSHNNQWDHLYQKNNNNGPNTHTANRHTFRRYGTDGHHSSCSSPTTDTKFPFFPNILLFQSLEAWCFFHFYFFLVLKLGCSTYIDSFDWIGFQSHFIFHFFMRTLSIHISDVNKDLKACTDKDQKPTRTRTRT